MEKIIENMILNFEQKKSNLEKIIKENSENKDNELTLLSAGQIIAFDFCINELKRSIETHKINKSKIEFTK